MGGMGGTTTWVPQVTKPKSVTNMNDNHVCQLPERKRSSRGVGDRSGVEEGFHPAMSPVARDITTTSSDSSESECGPARKGDQKYGPAGKGAHGKPALKGLAKARNVKRETKQAAAIGLSLLDGLAKEAGARDAARETAAMVADDKNQDAKGSLCARRKIPEDSFFYPKELSKTQSKYACPKPLDYRVCVADKQTFAEEEHYQHGEVEDLRIFRYAHYRVTNIERVPVGLTMKTFDMRADAAAAADLKHADPLLYRYDLEKEIYVELFAKQLDMCSMEPIDVSNTVKEHFYTNKCLMSHELASQVVCNLGVFLEEDDLTLLRRIKSQCHNCACSINLNRFEFNDVYIGTVYYVWHFAQSLKEKYKHTTNQVFQNGPVYRDMLSMDIELSKLMSKQSALQTLTPESCDIVINPILDANAGWWRSAWASTFCALHILKEILSILLMFLILSQSAYHISHLNQIWLISVTSDDSLIVSLVKTLNRYLPIPMYLLGPGWMAHCTANHGKWHCRMYMINSILIPFLLFGAMYLGSKHLSKMRAMLRTKTSVGSIRVLTFSNAKLALSSKLLSTLFTSCLALSSMCLQEIDHDSSFLNSIEAILHNTWVPITLHMRVILLNSCFGLSRTDYIDIALSCFHHVTIFINYLTSSMGATGLLSATYKLLLMRGGCLAKCVQVLVMVLQTIWYIFMYTPSLVTVMLIVLSKVMIALADSGVLPLLSYFTNSLVSQLKLGFLETCAWPLFVALCSVPILWWLQIRLKLYLKQVGLLLDSPTHRIKYGLNYYAPRRFL